MLFDQTKYIESTKEVIKNFTKVLFPDCDIPLAIPDLGDDNLSLSKPVIFIEYDNSVNIDPFSGKNNGRGKRQKRKLLRFSFQIITTGGNLAVLQRDRIVQSLEYEFMKDSNVKLLASKGIKEPDVRYMNSYRVREQVHLARLELFFKVSFLN